jgi:hypothetical protein
MGDRAIATILGLVVAGAAYALVGMWAAVRWGGVTSNGFKLKLRGRPTVTEYIPETALANAVPNGMMRRQGQKAIFGP